MEASKPTPAAAGGTATPPAPEPPNAMVTAEQPPEPDADAGSAGKEASEFDFDMDAAGNEFRVKLGGRPFIAREATIKTRKDGILKAREQRDANPPPPSEKADGEAVDEGDAAAVESAGFDALEASLTTFADVYEQLAEVLVHADGPEEGQPPTLEYVERHVRMSAYHRLFRRLNRAEGNA